jgi:hypothetical protein
MRGARLSISRCPLVHDSLRDNSTLFNLPRMSGQPSAQLNHNLRLRPLFLVSTEPYTFWTVPLTDMDEFTIKK